MYRTYNMLTATASFQTKGCFLVLVSRAMDERYHKLESLGPIGAMI